MPEDAPLEPAELAVAREKLAALPTAGFGQWPTPLERLDRFSETVGREIWIKRDDIQGVAVAGNKARKFDLLVGAALEAGYDTLVTTGAAQSNSARTGAAAAARAGLDCVLLLGGHEPALPTGNLLLDTVLGAEIRWAGSADWRALNAGVDAIVAELEQVGRRPFAAPVGASSPLGSLGFARAWLELTDQCEAVGLDPAAVVHTTTSGGTHAGMLVGRRLRDQGPDDVAIIGVCAGELFRDPAAGHLRLANEAADLLDVDLGLGPADVVIDLGQLGPGYGHVTPECVAAIRLLARTEAILCDPVYSGKGLAAVIELARSAASPGTSGDGPLVFWHTGGYHALFDPPHAAPILEE